MNSLHPRVRGCLIGTALVFSSLPVFGQTIPAPGDTTHSLIKAGADWRFFDRGGGLDAVWRAPLYDDSRWASGPAQLGYGDGDEATTVSFGPDATQKHITTYFRHAFDLADASHVQRLTLRLLRDDGAVVYLNGQEVVRDNLPAGPISAQTLAASSVAEENQFQEYVLGPATLLSGRNVVAVEVHQVNPSSSDLGFDLQLEALIGPGDPLPVVSIAATDPETTEPSPNTRVMPGAFTITRAGDATEPLLLFLELTGTAVNGQDYDQISQHVTMPPGETSVKILVGALDDALVEGDESVTATLSANPPINSLPNYRVDPQRNRAAVVIHDNDAPPGLPVVSLTGFERTLELCPPNALCVGVHFLLKRTGPSLDKPLTVFLHYGGTATADVDYHGLATQVTFKAGEDFAAVVSAPIDDALFEGDETVIADLVAGLDYAADPQRRQATIVIEDNDGPAAPVVSLVLVDPNAAETLITQNNIDWAEFRVLRTGPVTDELRVFLNTNQGSARLGEDYRLDGVNDGSAVRIPPGAAAVNVRLYPTDDDFYEGDESVFFHLIEAPTAAQPYQIDFAHSSVAMTIRDNDPVTTRLDITSPRSGQEFQPGEVIELRAQIIGPGSDLTWSVEFFDGDHRIGTTRPGAPIWWDNAVAGPHVITARASNPAGATLLSRPIPISVGSGPAWPVVGIVASSQRTGEPCPVCFVAPGVFTVSRTGPTTEALKVYLEFDGTATPGGPGSDYMELPPQVTIPAGAKSAEVLVLPFDDLLPEGPEIVRARIVSPEIATLGYVVSAFANEAMVVIFDDEPNAPKIRLDLVEPSEGAQFALGATIQVSALGVWTEGELDQPVKFFAGNVLIGQSDPPQLGRPTIPGLPSVHTISWTNPPQGRHVLTARFEAGPDVAVTSLPVAITVGSDPPFPTVSLETTPQNLQAREFCPLNMDCVYPNFVVRRTGPTTSELRVYLSYSGSATTGFDYPTLPPSVVIPAGRDSAFLMLVPNDDPLAEGPETVVARFTPVPGPGYIPNPDQSTATITIADDEPAAETVVSIGTVDEIASEISILAVIDPARFRISRSGDLSRDLMVFYSLHGSATPGVDYFEVTSPLQIPAGQSSATFDITPRFDQLAEGLETVVIRLEQSPVLGPLPSYDIAPGGREAVALIFDNGSSRTPGIEILSPEEGDQFPTGANIEIVVAAYHPTLDILRVEFYDGATKIGESALVLDKAVLGGLINHRLRWNNAPAGTHVLTARGFAGDGTTPLTSRPVQIKVGSDPPAAVVSLEATDRIAEESSAPLRRLNLIGKFTISRTGPTTDPLPVFVLYSGTAVPGVDYPHPPLLVMIPAGAAATSFQIEAKDDEVPEGLETVVARVVDCLPCPFPDNALCSTPCVNFQVDPTRESATVFIRDDGLTEASIAITAPKDGSHLKVGDPIVLEAIAIDLHGYIGRVEFLDGDQKIGESTIDFDSVPAPGTPIAHRFEWTSAAPGSHSLSARTVNADGSVLTSQPVQITVGLGADRAMVEIEATDPSALEGGANGALDVAVFTIRRIAGPLNLDLMIYLSIGGTATNGVDYAELTRQIRLPGGAASVQLVVTPVPDKALEGDEDVIIRIEPPICIAIAPPPPECYLVGQKAQARAVIRETVEDQMPSVAIVRPDGTSRLLVDTPIEIVAEARDPDGYVRKIEFLADGRKIGEAAIDFIQPPPPGQLQTFTFVWEQPTPGPHTLVARATDDHGAVGTSPPVGIKVGTSDLLPLVTVFLRDSFAVEPRANAEVNTATFRIQRFGPDADSLEVAYSLGGSAKNGLDYAELPGRALLAAGVRSVDVVIRPLTDTLSEGVETVVLQLEQPPAPGPGVPEANPYQVGQPWVAAAVISDTLLAPAPGVAQCMPLPGNLLHLCLAAESGQHYRVEASLDLRNWQTLSDAVSSDGALHFIDTEMANHRFRFYRFAPEPVTEPGG